MTTKLPKTSNRKLPETIAFRVPKGTKKKLEKKAKDLDLDNGPALLRAMIRKVLKGGMTLKLSGG